MAWRAAVQNGIVAEHVVFAKTKALVLKKLFTKLIRAVAAER